MTYSSASCSAEAEELTVDHGELTIADSSDGFEPKEVTSSGGRRESSASCSAEAGELTIDN